VSPLTTQNGEVANLKKNLKHGEVANLFWISKNVEAPNPSARSPHPSHQFCFVSGSETEAAAFPYEIGDTQADTIL
jgi:hypothetical protein